MDDVVRAALARWPDVPDVYGWLKLDARGNFRLRVPDDPVAVRFETIANAALLAFIGRNYLADARGCWLFQNGPQRVFVELEHTPWILRLAPDGRVFTHTGAPVAIDAVLQDDSGRPVLISSAGPGALDDRDLQAFLDVLVDAAGDTPDQDSLEAWLADPHARPLSVRLGGRALPIEAVRRAALPKRLGYVTHPAPPA